MKFLTLVAAIFLSANSFASDSLIKSLTQELRLKDFYCVVKGETQTQLVLSISSTTTVFAENKREALKLCLMKFDSSAVEIDGNINLVAKILGNTVVVKDINITAGRINKNAK